jgi:L-lysine exporter family protein LysE/ArgO
MAISEILTATISGLLFSWSLAVAIGAQNTFVIRQGLNRNHIGAVVALCAGSDAVLITAGVAGVGAALSGHHWLMSVVRMLGVALLAGYALFAARGALPSAASSGTDEQARSSLRATIAACLGFTWLNPGVYLDTVILLGSVANEHPTGRWWFALGAILASASWFAALGFASRSLAPLLRRPSAERVLDGFVAATMTLAAVRLALGA